VKCVVTVSKQSLSNFWYFFWTWAKLKGCSTNLQHSTKLQHSTNSMNDRPGSEKSFSQHKVRHQRFIISLAAPFTFIRYYKIRPNVFFNNVLSLSQNPSHTTFAKKSCLKLLGSSSKSYLQQSNNITGQFSVYTITLGMCIMEHLEVLEYSGIFVLNPEYRILFRNDFSGAKWADRAEV